VRSFVADMLAELGNSAWMGTARAGASLDGFLDVLAAMVGLVCAPPLLSICSPNVVTDSVYTLLCQNYGDLVNSRVISIPYIGWECKFVSATRPEMGWLNGSRLEQSYEGWASRKPVRGWVIPG